MARLCFHNVPGEVEHVLGDFHVLDVVKIGGGIPNLVGLAQHAHKPLVARFKRDDVLTVGQHDAADGDLIKRSDGVPDDGVGIVACLAIWNDVVGTYKVKVVDL